MVAAEDQQWLRKVVGQEDVPYDRTFDGKVLTRPIDILECGHRKAVRRGRQRGPISDDRLPFELNESRVCETCRREADHGSEG